MPALGAPTAKRDVEYGVIEPENLQEWASAQTAGGTFMLTPSTTKGVPEVRYWRGILSGAFPGNDRALLIFTSGEMYRTDTAGGQWLAPWRKVADCIAPEVHELPLADHWDPYGDGLCWYARNQFGEVSIGMLVRSTSTVSVDGTQFATMPEGFRPRVTVVAPANVTANDYSHSVCHVTINPDGGVYLHFDASSLSGKTIIQLVCPVFHYPAG